MIYKRNHQKLSDVKDIEYIATNNNGVYINSTVVGENFAPYHGVVIMQVDKLSKVIVPKVVENIIPNTHMLLKKIKKKKI